MSSIPTQSLTEREPPSSAIVGTPIKRSLPTRTNERWKWKPVDRPSTFSLKDGKDERRVKVEKKEDSSRLTDKETDHDPYPKARVLLEQMNALWVEYDKL